MLEEITSSRLGEKYYRYTHSSGVTVLLYPMKGYSTITAQFSVKFGSIDNCCSIEPSQGLPRPALPATPELPTTARVTTSAVPRTSKRTLRYCWISFSTPISPRRTSRRSAA